jgi:WD40 repeat protein
MTVCLWDVNSYTKARNTLEPTTIYKGHTSVVGVSGPPPTILRLVLTVSLPRTLTGTQQEKMCSQVSAMTSCFFCVLLTSSGVPLFVYSCTHCRVRWDTRSPEEPTTKVPAHDREILACAFNPAQESLLITGSADKVCPRNRPGSRLLISYMFPRPLPSTTFVTPQRESIPLSHTLTRSCTSHGHPTYHPYSPPHRVTGVSTYGTLRRLGSNRHLMTRKMDHQNSCIFTGASHSTLGMTRAHDTHLHRSHRTSV